MPTCWIIAGPNGAGKTTFALNYLPQLSKCQSFINADLIAAGLAPLAPENSLLNASKLFLKEIQTLATKREDFAFETTLSGRSYLKFIDQLKKEGWHVELLYLALPNVEASKLRVAERVLHGGHNIPATDITRRFPRSLHNLFTKFAPLVSHTFCFMNTNHVPELIFEQTNEKLFVSHADYFKQLKRQAGL